MALAIKNVAIVGATGQVGSSIISSLQRRNAFNITAITRSESNSEVPASVRIAKGSYNDASFLASAFAGQDVVILALAAFTSHETQLELIDAAVKAGVKWILPNEYGSDNANVEQRKDVPFSDIKTQFRERVEEHGAKWIGVVTNPWFDLALRGGYLGIDVRSRKATIYGGGDVKFVTTNLPRVGEGVAALLSLPEARFTEYANRFVYLGSHVCSQREILHAVQRVTGTSDADWEMDKVDDVPGWREDARQRFYKGEIMGSGVPLIMGQLYIEGSGCNYTQKLDKDNEILELELEDLDESVKRALE